MSRAQRTDVHRPSTLVPADYEQHVDYDCGGGWMEPPIGVDCTRPVPAFDAQGRSTGSYHGTHCTGDRCCFMRAIEVAHAARRRLPDEGAQPARSRADGAARVAG